MSSNSTEATNDSAGSILGGGCRLDPIVLSVQCACFSPDGSQLVVGAGERVMVYDPGDGALIRLLQAHRGAVHTLAYCADGKKFASGSADKNVIIWTSKMEGILKYSHSEAIQCVAYNPVTFQLASCAASDFAFWSSEVKAVQKYRVAGRITCCAWATSGHHLAVGLASGCVSIRDKCGEEVQRWTRDSAVWALAFSGSTLLVTDWNDTLSFYNIHGQQVLKERNIGISAVWVCTMGELIVVAGAGGWTVLTAEGVPVSAAALDWVWCAVPAPARDSLALACQDGTLWCYQLVFSTVHGLYRDRYAYRENITDVIIQHLSTGNKVRIKCHDRVHKIAIYKKRLAVQLPERIVVYEVGDSDPDCMLYRVREKIPLKQECSLLVATGDALLLCQDTKLVMIGKKIPKTWTVPAPIRYVKVTPLYSEEVLLLGLLNGEVWQVQVKSGSSTVLVRAEGSGAGAVRCLDVSASRARLAVVDEHSVCRVYALPAGDLLYTSKPFASCLEEYVKSSVPNVVIAMAMTVVSSPLPPRSRPAWRA
ncbi:Intraflagellar transport protein 122 homolog [Eumeta japonica]|uniref:Intraflagellar transport protein 122 homolog n=1 Tax=Eumeta variegata TaxID=151549 RepID=A0A4C1V3R6_EUMVA|nr:Intraflagellar transport protein 122 homolog [Eumeta japonica]